MNDRGFNEFTNEHDVIHVILSVYGTELREYKPFIP